jgi:hypothetical protein
MDLELAKEADLLPLAQGPLGPTIVEDKEED